MCPQQCVLVYQGLLCYINRERKSVYELVEDWQLTAEFTYVYRSVKIEQTRWYVQK